MKDQRRKRARGRRQVIAQCKPLVEKIQRLTDEVEYILDQASVRQSTARRRRRRRPACHRASVGEHPQTASGRILEMSPSASGVRGSWSIKIQYKNERPQLVLSGRLTELLYHLASAPPDEQAEPTFCEAAKIREAMRAKNQQAVVNLVHRLRKCMTAKGLPKELIETQKAGGPRYRIRLTGGLPDESPAIAESPQIRQWAARSRR